MTTNRAERRDLAVANPSAVQFPIVPAYGPNALFLKIWQSRNERLQLHRHFAGGLLAKLAQIPPGDDHRSNPSSQHLPECQNPGQRISPRHVDVVNVEVGHLDSDQLQNTPLRPLYDNAVFNVP
jgi:hypothetical protein